MIYQSSLMSSVKFPADFYELLQKTCKPGVWSKGVSMARAGGVMEESKKPGEKSFRVKSIEKSVAQSVTLWPEDEDWFCNCEDKNEVCAHVAAAIIAWKGDLFEKKKSPHTRVEYRFLRATGKLKLERWIETERLTQSLVSRVGGIQSGRIQGPPISVSQDDLAIDAAWTTAHTSELDRSTLLRILKLMSGISQVTLDGAPIEVNSHPLILKGGVSDEAGGYRLKVIRDPSVKESFANGAALCTGNILRPIEAPLLNEEEKRLLAGQGRFFPKEEEEILVVRIIPLLERKLPIEVFSTKLPKLIQVQPELRFDVQQEGETLKILPIIGPPEGVQDQKALTRLEPEEEQRLHRKLRTELQLAAGHRVEFHGHEAAEFLLKLQKNDFLGKMKGPRVHEGLIPKIAADQQGMQVSFEIPGEGLSADPQKVFQAWRENSHYVPLIQGGWAPLPHGWLDRFGEKIQQIILAKGDQKRMPTYLAPQMIDLFDEVGQSYPDSLKKLKERLEKLGHQPELPKDLKASLRVYQRTGVDWLFILREAEVGAMLADDMGLGKTLQALCAIQGRTLIVAPTSVIHGWKDQIEKFRPGLQVSVYSGGTRKLDSEAELILTSYAILRIDQNLLSSQEWDTVILDESQTIKNPESQIARAAQRLSGKFKIALSGTPIENKPEDLWSQFQFLNPGLLGTREHFQEFFSGPISKGDPKTAQDLKKRIQPFFLRRLKKEVAPELPAKTETVLYCDLTPDERELYNAILTSTQKEVLEKLEKGTGVIAALELLLRLRQVCCHSGLVPGQSAVSSSKINLLMEILQESIDLGHRALVFSQWTSYLDLIEPHLKKNGFTFNRLDGSTQDRQKVVDEFQDPAGPKVMLLSLKAGGVGLNLTAADHVFLMDPWWNPTVENQAIDRAHRIGQTQPVLVHRLVAENTIESQILELQSAKLAMAGAVLEGAGVAAPNREELLRLLSLV